MANPTGQDTKLRSRIEPDLRRARKWARFGILLTAVAFLVSFLAGHPLLIFFFALWILVGVTSYRLTQIIDYLGEYQSCERCGEAGDTLPYRGNPAGLVSFREPILLCARCRWAHDRYFELHVLLSGPAVIGFKTPSYLSAESAFGSKTREMLPLIALAGEDPDLARRIVTEEHWNEYGDRFIEAGRAWQLHRRR